ncbi:MAG: ribonuclease HI [Deltaproteobacteria bacterium]|nr:ribonuclease HI [Deltaproteobacteria bacterium]
MKTVVIHTDGACSGNPGPGGYAAVLKYATNCKEVVGGFRLTTNNRMELFAAIAALKVLKEPCTVSLVTDSQYLYNSMVKRWVDNWQQKNWQRGGRKIPNSDLWQELLQLSAKHSITWEWVRGHSENAENERCDRLAREAIKQGNLPADTGYETP